MLHKLFNLIKTPIQKETLWEIMNPFVEIDSQDDSIIWDKKKHCSKVIQIRGKEYQGLSSDKKQQYFNKRLAFLKNFDEDISITTFSTREIEHNLESLKIEEDNYVNKIINKWNKNFKNTYRTHHYIVISTSSLLGNTVLNQIESANLKRAEQKRKKINSHTNSILNLLQEFDPELLTGTALSSFWSSYINGKKTNQIVPNNLQLKNILCESTLFFPQDKDYMVYKNNIEIYSKWLTIKLFENDSFSEKLLEEIMSYKAEFTIYQNFQRYSKLEALKLLTKKENNKSAHSQSSGMSAFEEIDDLREKIEQNETSIYRYSFAIQMKSRDLKKLTKDIESLKELINSYGYRTAVETTNIEPLYWSIFPTYNNYNSTKRDLISHNVCALNSFTTVAQGFPKCDWGNEPVTTFNTLLNTSFDFTFHNSTNPTALGHTLIIAGSESGKTTLTSFLATHSLKYEDLHVVAFDKLNGLYTWCNILDGSYVQFNNDISLNPLQLEDNSINREFLKTFFQIMSNKFDAESGKKIDEALEQVFTHLSKNERNLEEFFNALGTKTNEDDVVANIYSWVKGSNKRFFNSKKDSLSFDNKITVFAMDSIFNNREAPTLVSLYIFQKIKQLDKPVLIFIDEIVSYLREPNFANQILELLLEIRKRRGVLILAGQDYKFFYENEVGRKILGDSLANLILYAPVQDDETYPKALNLTDEEYYYLRNATDKRKPLFKRVQDQTSTVLDVDLSPLGKYLKIFDSSAHTVTKVEILKRNSKQWKERFIND